MGLFRGGVRIRSFVLIHTNWATQFLTKVNLRVDLSQVRCQIKFYRDENEAVRDSLSFFIMACALEKPKIMYLHNSQLSKLYFFFPEKTAVLLSVTASFSLLSEGQYGALTMVY